MAQHHKNVWVFLLLTLARNPCETALNKVFGKVQSRRLGLNGFSN